MYIFKILEAVCLNYFVSVKHEEVLFPIHLITEQQMGNIIMLPSTLALYCHTNGTLLTGISSTVWCFLTSCQLAYSSQMFVLREKEMAKSFGNNNTTINTNTNNIDSNNNDTPFHKNVVHLEPDPLFFLFSSEAFCNSTFYFWEQSSRLFGLEEDGYRKPHLVCFLCFSICFPLALWCSTACAVLELKHRSLTGQGT